MKNWIRKVVALPLFDGDPARDRSVGLLVFGALDILFGLFCFALAMMLLIAVSAVGLGGMKPVHFAMAMGFLCFLTGWFCVMGMGSLRGRRWARALLLVGGWMTIFFGTMSLALALYVLPEVYNLLVDRGSLSPAVVLGLLYFAIFVLVLLQVVFPAVGILFYGSKSVQATCERLNPNRSWTDRYPLPLLAMGFISGTGCLSIVFAATTNYLVFFYGHVISGMSGFLAMAAVSLGCGYVGWGAFSRNMHAWWGAYLLIVLVAASMMLTFSELDIAVMYAQMGYTAEQIENLEQFLPFNPAMFTYMSCAWGIMACIYLIWVRDRFRPEEERVVVKSYQQLKAEEEAARPFEHPRVRMRLD